MEKQFIVITENKRVKGKITGSLYQIKNNRPVRISDFGFLPQSNRGMESEVVNALVVFGSLPEKALTEEGYINYKEKNYNLLIVEGRGLNYIQSF